METGMGWGVGKQGEEQQNIRNSLSTILINCVTLTKLMVPAYLHFFI